MLHPLLLSLIASGWLTARISAVACVLQNVNGVLHSSCAVHSPEDGSSVCANKTEVEGLHAEVVGLRSDVAELRSLILDIHTKVGLVPPSLPPSSPPTPPPLPPPLTPPPPPIVLRVYSGGYSSTGLHNVFFYQAPGTGYNGGNQLTNSIGHTCSYGRGISLVVVQLSSLNIVQCKGWDTYGRADALNATNAYLTGSGPDTLSPYKNTPGYVLMLGAEDSAQTYLDYDGLRQVLDATVTSLSHRVGYALITDLGTMTRLNEWIGTTSGSFNTIEATIAF